MVIGWRQRLDQKMSCVTKVAKDLQTVYKLRSPTPVTPSRIPSSLDHFDCYLRTFHLSSITSQTSNTSHLLPCQTICTAVPQAKSLSMVRYIHHHSTLASHGHPSTWLKLTTITLQTHPPICTESSSGTVSSTRTTGVVCLEESSVISSVSHSWCHSLRYCAAALKFCINEDHPNVYRLSSKQIAFVE